MLRSYLETLSALGPANALRVRRGKPAISRHLRHPVHIRRGTSDKLVFGQIFREREYRCLDHLADCRHIVDAGANVGYSAAYLLSRFPEAQLFAIEPDPGNFEQMMLNCAPYGDRFRAILGAVWDERTKLSLTNMAEGEEWGRQVSERGGDVEAYTMADIIAWSGFPRISLLKMDVEGAEKQIFSGDVSWLSLVDNIVVELHGEAERRAFHNAIAGLGYSVSQCGELAVCLKSQC